jgi:hypothetical protein
VKQTTIYPSGHGRNGENHLSRSETSVELYRISFDVDGKTYRIFPENLTVYLGGDKHGVRLDTLLARLISDVATLRSRVDRHGKVLTGYSQSISAIAKHGQRIDDIKHILHRRGIEIPERSTEST